MKGVIGYIVAIFIVCILMVIGFYFLGELLDSEIEISTISRKYSEIVNEVEYSQFYFRKYLENECLESRGRGYSYGDIVKEISKTITLNLKNSNSHFEFLNAYQEDDFFIVEGKITYNYKDLEKEVNLSKFVKFRFSP
ncbi:MAG: hypothetical protein QW040_00495 [Candidatus Aenigmatarchaeota archaeon]